MLYLASNRIKLNILFNQFRRAIHVFSCFSLNDIHKHFPYFDNKRLVEWQKKGYIKKVRNGYYIWEDFQDEIINCWSISHKCYKPSYISLQSALSFYSFNPEGVFSITAISTAKTFSFEHADLKFDYRHVKDQLFWGYEVIKSPNGMPYCIATPEKAILDTLYLNESISSYADFDEMRFNKDEINKKINKNTFQQYSLLFGGHRFKLRSLQFIKWLDA